MPLLPVVLACAAHVSAQVVARPAPRDFVPLVDGAPVAAPAQQDAVLGVFEGERDTLFWMQRDARAGLLSPSVQRHMTAHPQLGSRRVGDVLRAAGGGWLILRDPASNQEHFTFLDGGVFYLSVPPKMRVGERDLDRAGLSAQGENLIASYGSAQAGAVAIKRFRASRQGAESTVGVFSFRDGKVVEGAAADASALAALLADPSMAAASQALSAAADGGSALERMRTFLEGGAARTATLSVNQSGAALFKLREGERDKAYVYVNGTSARYLPAGE